MDLSLGLLIYLFKKQNKNRLALYGRGGAVMEQAVRDYVKNIKRNFVRYKLEWKNEKII